MIEGVAIMLDLPFDFTISWVQSVSAELPLTGLFRSAGRFAFTGPKGQLARKFYF